MWSRGAILEYSARMNKGIGFAEPAVPTGLTDRAGPSGRSGPAGCSGPVCRAGLAGLAIRILRFAACVPLILVPGCSSSLPRAPFLVAFNGGIENRSSVPVRIIADSKIRKGYIRYVASGESTSQECEDVDFVENPLTLSWKKINPVLVPPSGYLILTDDLIGAEWPQLTEKTGFSYVRHVLSEADSGSIE